MSNQPHSTRVFQADIPFDQFCSVGETDWPELTHAQRTACIEDVMVPIFDADTTLVALVPGKYADVILEIINRFDGDPLTDEDWKVVDRGSLQDVERRVVVHQLPRGFALPVGYTYTGECRLPKAGEIYLDRDGCFTAHHDFTNNEWPILRKA